MKRIECIEFVQFLPDPSGRAVAEVVNSACAAMADAVEKTEILVYGPRISIANGPYLVLRWSTTFPREGTDILLRLYPKDYKQPPSRFHPVDTSPEAVARGYASCIDSPPAAKTDYPPEFSEPVPVLTDNGGIVHTNAPMAESVVVAPVTPEATETLTAMAPGEALAEPVVFAPPDVPEELADASPDIRKATTSDDVAIARGMSVMVHVPGLETQPGVVVSGPGRGGAFISAAGKVRVRTEDNLSAWYDPTALTASKE
jgi:hypothetical protein